MNQEQLRQLEEEMRRKMNRIQDSWWHRKYGTMDDAVDHWSEILKRKLEDVPVSDQYL